MRKLIVITGTTATGKTALALKWAMELNGEIVSADSRQIYKHLDIVTGKDFADHNWQKMQTTSAGYDLGFYTINGTPVWLYDVLDPKRYFSVFDYVECARTVIKGIVERGRTPIVVGGTYYYLQALLYGLKGSPMQANLELRQQLEQQTVSQLQQQLQTLNEAVFASLNSSDRQNKRRLSRWIEKCQAGIKIQDYVIDSQWAKQFTVEIYGRTYQDKQKLKDQIAHRVKQRLDQGALSETEILLSMGYQSTDPGLVTLGYQQLIKYLRGDWSLEEAIADWTNKEIRYGKRQLTFMKRNLAINWTLL